MTIYYLHYKLKELKVKRPCNKDNDSNNEDGFMKKYAAGIDIGGTNLRLGVVREDGKLESETSVPLGPARSAGPDAQVGFIAGNIKKFIWETEKNGGKKIDVIGIGVAGQVDEASGVVLFSPNLNWHGVPLKKAVEEAAGLKTCVTNDLTAIAYGEWRFGAGRGYDDLICIFAGTGIGSGIITGGGVLEGCSGAAGEIGHITVVSGGRKCTCGNRGCLEAYAGGWGMAEIAKERALASGAGNGDFQSMVKTAGGVDLLTAEVIALEYYAGNKAAVDLVGETALYLADGVITAVNLLNPCAVILGGGVIDGIPEIFDTVKVEVFKRALKAATSKMAMLKSGLGKAAGVIGAAAWAAASQHP